MNKWIFFAFFLIGSLVFWLIFDTNSHPKKSEDLQNSTIVNEIVSSQIDSNIVRKIPETYSECEDFSAELQKQSSLWRRENSFTGNQLLEKGLGIDEVTVVLEHLWHFNAAKRWRIEEIKLNSPHAEFTASTREKVESMLGSALPDIFNIDIEYPQKPLADYPSISKDQRINAIQQTSPTVDDLTFFIKQQQLSESELIELLPFVEEPERLVGSTSDDELTLLDYAVTHELDELFWKLLELGVKPYHDSYLDNSLDFALRRLYADYVHHHDDQLSKPDQLRFHFNVNRNSTHNIQSTLAVVQALMDLGMLTNHKINSEGEVTFGYAFTTFKLDNQQIQFFYENYNLDLMAIPQRERLNNQQIGSTTIQKMDDEKTQFLNEAFEGIEISTAQEKCETIQNKIAAAWQPDSALPLIQKMKSIYADDQQSIHAALYAIDPSLVPCTGFLHSLRGISQVDDKVFRIFDRHLRDNQPSEAFTYLSSMTLSEDQNHYLFYQLARFYPDFINEFADAGMIPDIVDFFRLIQSKKLTVDTLKKFESSSIDTFTTDVRGWTLLHYAVRNKNFDLIEYLVEQNYPYQGYQYYPDALHQALSSWKLTFSHKTMLKTVGLLMPLHPQIDQFHLARMKVIELKYPSLFQTLIENFPQLEPGTHDQFPESICSSFM